MMFPTLRKLALILLCTAFASGQTVEEKKPTEAEEKLRKEAVGFLRETLADVNGMRSVENRISFTADIAALMWFHDEREARGMYHVATGDYRDLLGRYDALMNSLGPLTDGEADSRGSRFLSYGLELTERGRISRKFSAALIVGQQIALALAEHDGDLAYSFYVDSISGISNPEFRRQIEQGNSHFELQLLAKIASNNPRRAVQLATRTLARGIITYQHVDLLRKIYAKDPDRGAEFGGAILSRAKSDKYSAVDFYSIGSLLEFGTQTFDNSRRPGEKRAVYTLAELRDLADVLAQSILSRPDSDGGSGLRYVDLIQRYQPGRAAQIRSKYSRGTNPGLMGNTSNTVVNSMGYGSGPGYSSTNTNTNANTAQSIDDFGRIKQLPKEERDKFIAQARKIIMTTPGRDKRIAALGVLATHVANLGDKELASEIMRDAEALVNPSPRNYQDFVLTWMLATGYSTSDPDRAFTLLEEVIGRSNDTVTAFVKVAEFMDVAEEVVHDGEVQVGALGGQLVRNLTNELSMAGPTLKALSTADFGKMKGLTNRFDRLEIRVLAKMMVLRAVLDNKRKTDSEDPVVTQFQMTPAAAPPPPPPPVRKPD